MFRGTPSYSAKGLDNANLFVLLGQSNCSGSGADYDGEGLGTERPSPHVTMRNHNDVLMQAIEPTHNSTGLDTGHILYDVNRAQPYTDTHHIHSVWLMMAKQLHRETGRPTLLVPCALGSTLMTDPDNDDKSWAFGGRQHNFDRTTLWGNANAATRIALKGNPPSCVFILGYESSADSAGPTDHLATYASDWAVYVADVRATWGANVPIIYTQLGNGTAQPLRGERHEGAEHGRAMETGAFGGALTTLANHYMVPTFDLPLNDSVHLNRDAIEILRHRLTRAYREHVLGEPVNGTGPRMIELLASGSTLQYVTFDKAINAPVSNYDNQFKVYDNGVERAISSVARTTTYITNDTVELTHAAVSGTKTTSYGEPTVAVATQLTNVVVDSDGLPAPSFGPIIDFF